MADLPLYVCRRAAGPIAIDGRLDEPTWRAADVMALSLTDTGAKPRLGTVVRTLWDDRYLYVGFHCVDTDVWATMAGRDMPLWEEEVVEIFLDDDRDGIGYFELVCNPLGALVDVFCLHERHGTRFKALRDWNADGVLVAVTVDGDPTRRDTRDRSWTAEWAIPFDQIVMAPHVPPANGDTWRANFYRIEQGRDAVEYTAWSPTGEINYHHPERFGTLVFSTEPAA